MPYQMLLMFGIFTVISFVLYIITPSKYRYLVLLLTSVCSFVAVSTYSSVFLLITILTTYGAGVWMDKIVSKHPTKGLEKSQRKQIKAKVKKKKKGVVFLYLFVNIGLLLVLKYFNFFYNSIGKLFGEGESSSVLKIMLPLGISYYTLQAISYVIDVYRGKYKAEKNVLKLGLFVAFFPQLHEGPFGRYDLLMPQLTKGEQIKVNDFYNGTMTILVGLFKIFMIANRSAMISDSIFGNYENYGGFIILFGGVMFTLQLYAEFSGYIDIARGIAKIFGIDLAQNFDMPFLAQNVAEFWRRWHISLGAFFRDYVFYPVSTSKWLSACTKKMKMQMSNFVSITVSLLFVWFLTGLWHGASEKYICYGLYYFVLIVIYNLLSPLVEKLLDKMNVSKDNKILAILRIAKTLLLVLIGMIMFRAENMQVFADMFARIFQPSQSYPLFEIMDVEDFVVLIVSTLVMLLCAVLKLKNIDLWQKYYSLTPAKKYLVGFLLFLVVMIFGAYGLDYLPPDPIYGGF